MRLIDITDFQDPALDVYARISEGQLLNRAEPEKGMFIAEDVYKRQVCISKV